MRHADPNAVPSTCRGLRATRPLDVKGPWLAVFATSVLVLAGLGLRLYGTSWGNPHSYHYDEPFVVKPALRMVADGDWNPRFFRYPSALIYAEAAVVSYEHDRHGMDLLAPEGIAYGPSELGPWVWPAIVGGRRLVAAFGAATIAAAGWLGYALGGPAAAIVVAALVAGLPLHVEHSHYLTTDVPATALAVLALALVTAFGKYRSGAFGAGLLLGAAVATKYTVALTSPLVLAIAAMEGRPGGWRGPLLVAVASLLGFVALCPYAVLDAQTFLAELAIVRDHYRGGHLGSEGDANWLWYLARLRSDGMGIVGMVLLAAGGLSAMLPDPDLRAADGAHRPQSLIRRNHRIALSILLLALAWFAWLGSVKVRFERNLLPAVVLFCIPAGYGLASTYRTLRQRRPLVGSVFSLVLAGALLVPAIASYRLSARMTADDTRSQALSWIEANVPHGAGLVREEYTPRPDPTRYRVDYLQSLGDRPIDWYRSRGFDYAIASSLMYNRILRDRRPSSIAAADVYRWILSHPELVSFSSAGERTGPVITVFDLREPDASEPTEP